MVSLPNDFWSGWIVVITVVSLVGLAWLVWSVYFASEDVVADQVWDETLREGSAPAPLWWFWLILSMLAVTVVYLMLYPGLGSYRGTLRWSQGGRIAASEIQYQDEFRERRELIAAAAASELRDDQRALRAGSSLFQNHCAACHGPNAEGQANLFPNLADASWQWGGDDASIEQTIARGRQAIMPGWRAVLADNGVEQMADYVLALSSGNAASLAGTDGARLFAQYCSACHGADGAGQPVLGAPALNDDIWLYGGSRDAIVTSIAEGRSGVMPAFEQRLDAAQIKMLVVWLGRHEPAAR